MSFGCFRSSSDRQPVSGCAPSFDGEEGRVMTRRLSGVWLLLLAPLSISILACSAFAQEGPPLGNTQGPSPLTQEVRPITPLPEVPLSSKDPVMLEKHADSVREQKDYLQAIDYYQAAAKLKPTALLYNKIGMSYIGMLRLDPAAKALKRAIHMDKKYAEAYNNLGVVYHLKKKYGNAIKNYKKAIELNDLSASFHSNLGTTYVERKDYPDAVKEYQRAFDLDPDVFERSSRAGISARISSPEDRARFSYVLAKMFAGKGDSDKALQYLRKAMEDGYPDINNVYKDSEFATLRKDERFTELMAAKPPAIQ